MSVGVILETQDCFQPETFWVFSKHTGKHFSICLRESHRMFLCKIRSEYSFSIFVAIRKTACDLDFLLWLLPKFKTTVSSFWKGINTEYFLMNDAVKYYVSFQLLHQSHKTFCEPLINVPPFFVKQSISSPLFNQQEVALINFIFGPSQLFRGLKTPPERHQHLTIHHKQ